MQNVIISNTVLCEIVFWLRTWTMVNGLAGVFGRRDEENTIMLLAAFNGYQNRTHPSPENDPSYVDSKKTGNGINVKGSLDWRETSTDEKGNVIQNGYQDEFGRDVKFIKINGKLVSDGSIVRIGSDGKMEVVNIDQVKQGSKLFVNGILNDPLGAVDGLKLISKEMGSETYLVYNSSGGATDDLAHSSVGRVGRQSEGSQEVIKALIESGKIDTIMAHSQGSLITGNALSDVAERKGEDAISKINWVTFGAPAGRLSIPDGLRSATFYQNTMTDPVTYLGSLGRKVAVMNNPNTYRVIDSEPGYGHMLDSGYTGAIRDYGRRRNAWRYAD